MPPDGHDHTVRVGKIRLGKAYALSPRMSRRSSKSAAGISPESDTKFFAMGPGIEANESANYASQSHHATLTAILVEGVIHTIRGRVARHSHGSASRGGQIGQQARYRSAQRSSRHTSAISIPRRRAASSRLCRCRRSDAPERFLSPGERWSNRGAWHTPAWLASAAGWSAGHQWTAHIGRRNILGGFRRWPKTLSRFAF